MSSVVCERVEAKNPEALLSRCGIRLHEQVKGRELMKALKFKLGADASVAAGPVGRSAAAGTNLKLNAQILSYSRAKGVFAGGEPGRCRDASRSEWGQS